MSEADSGVFTLMVVGDEPDEIIKKYDANLEVEPYVKYHYKDKEKYRKKAIKIAQEVVENSDETLLGLYKYSIIELEQ